MNHSSTVKIVNVCNDSARLLERLGIPLIATITPQPDPIYGHTFKWPPAVARFLQNSAKRPHSNSDSNSDSHQEVLHV